jgi:hypothetical protein
MEKNIELAIQKEEEYLNRKVNHCDPTANIYEYLAVAGYDNIDEFLNDKTIYELKSQNYEIVEEPEINANIPVPYLENEIPAFLYTINCETNYAFLPLSWTDYTLIERYGYTPVKLGYDNSNGPILSANGDLRIYFIYPKTIDLSYNYFANKLVEYLSNYFDNVLLDNNDIMIDNTKVIGGADTVMNNMRIVVFQINFVDKTEAIQNICPARSKQPGYIDSSIVTAEQIKNEFLTWLMK